MKNIILITLMLFTLDVMAQQSIGVFQIFGKEYNFNATEPKENGEYDLWIDAYPIDKIVGQGGMNIKFKDINYFVESLKKAKDKYVEWNKTAIDNNVTELNKNLEITLPNATGYFVYGGEWHFDFSIQPYFKYLITQEASGKISYGLIIYTGKYVSSKNEYIDSDTFCYAFYSEKDINTFISLFNTKLVEEKFSKQKSKEDLFN